MKNIIGDYQAFFSLALRRLNKLHIDISGCELSHLACRTETYEEYLRAREKTERHCISNVENIWNGRPMSMGCQRHIAAKIISKQADDVLALKGNQGALRKDTERSAGPR